MSSENPHKTLIQGQCYQLDWHNSIERPMFIGLSIFNSSSMNVYDVLRFGEGFIVLGLSQNGYVEILSPRGTGLILIQFHHNIIFSKLDKQP